MHAIFAFFLDPMGRKIILGCVAIAAIFGALLHVEMRGREAERSRIERANATARDAADDAMRGPLECAGTWNREAGKCER